MLRINQSILFLATFIFLVIFSIPVQAQVTQVTQAPSGRPHSSIAGNGTFHNSTSTRKPTSTKTSATLVDSGGFATGTSIINAGENTSPHVTVGGLVAVLGWLLAF